MDIEINIQDIFFTLIRKWKLLVALTLIGTLLGYVFAINFTTPTYTSQVKFLTYAVDTNDNINMTSAEDMYSDSVRTSNTSKMNYAMKMLETYIEILETNKFARTVANDLNKRLDSNYTSSTIQGSMTFESIEDTAMFTVTITTGDPNLSYQIAKQLETTIPKTMKKTNNGLVHASVEDSAIKPTAPSDHGYMMKTLLGAILGFVIAVSIISMRSFMDVRIKNEDELSEKYDIPVLGSVPDYNSKSVSIKEEEKVYVKK